VTALRTSAGTGARELWTAVRPGIVAGAIQCAVVIGVARLLLPDFDTWHSVAGLDLGLLVPLVILGALMLLGAAVYAISVEIAERGALRSLISNLRLILRPAAG
jgi:hypothetical protein